MTSRKTGEILIVLTALAAPLPLPALAQSATADLAEIRLPKALTGHANARRNPGLFRHQGLGIAPDHSEAARVLVPGVRVPPPSSSAS